MKIVKHYGECWEDKGVYLYSHVLITNDHPERFRITCTECGMTALDGHEIKGKYLGHANLFGDKVHVIERDEKFICRGCGQLARFSSFICKEKESLASQLFGLEKVEHGN